MIYIEQLKFYKDDYSIIYSIEKNKGVYTMPVLSIEKDGEELFESDNTGWIFQELFDYCYNGKDLSEKGLTEGEVQLIIELFVPLQNLLTVIYRYNKAPHFLGLKYLKEEKLKMFKRVINSPLTDPWTKELLKRKFNKYYIKSRVKTNFYESIYQTFHNE